MATNARTHHTRHQHRTHSNQTLPSTNEPMQPDRQTSTIIVMASEADNAVASIRQRGGVLLSFSTRGGGRLALNVILPPSELLQEWDANGGWTMNGAHQRSPRARTRHRGRGTPPTPPP